MRSRRLVVVLSSLASVALVAGIPAAARAATPYCGITWGSLAKSDSQMTAAPIVGARVGQHDCWDRLVIDVGGLPAPGFNVRYTDGFYNSGSGDPIPVSGGAVLTVSARAPDYDINTGQPTVPWRVGTHIVSPAQFSAAGFRTFRDLVAGVSFEGVSDFGLGVRARLPFRVFTLTGPDSNSRLVIDVAHQW